MVIKKLRIADEDGDEASSWTTEPLSNYFEAEGETHPSQVLAPWFERSDGVGLFYPGKINSVLGPSEAGKSMVVLIPARNVLNAGLRVLFMDYECAGAPEILSRLLLLGTDPAMIHNLLYMAPLGPPPDVEWKRILMGPRFALAIIDAVTGSMVEVSRSGMSNDDITAWTRTIAGSIIEYTQAAVIIVDHSPLVTKPGRLGAGGGQAKRATLSGASYRVHTVKRLIRGKIGILDLYLDKDRQGLVRQVANLNNDEDSPCAARMTFDSTDPDNVIVTIDPPPVKSTRSPGATTPAVRPSDSERLAAIKQRVMAVLEKGPAPSLRSLRVAVTGDHNEVQDMITELIADGHVRTEPGPKRAKRHIFVRPLESPSADPFQTTGAENGS